MILRSLRPKYIGPFDGSAELLLDQKVTVITGPNDSGKTLLLKSILLACTSTHLLEPEANIDRYSDSTVRWQKDEEISVEAEFILSDVSSSAFGIRKVSTGNILHFKRSPSPESFKSAAHIPGTSWNTSNINDVPLPKVLMLPHQSAIRQILPLGSLNEAESAFVRLAFGTGFNLTKHEALLPYRRAFNIKEAEGRLNLKLSEIMPAGTNLSFSLSEIAGKPSEIAVAVIDKHQGFSPIESRGTGIRKILDVMGSLLLLDPQNGHSIVLYDEPETSLHADSQHAIRQCLEKIAENPTIQVVYTTHSPAMINIFRPESIRVVEKCRSRDRAIATIQNRAFEGNYSRVRASLGISPADSLLYAPITVVCEGVTEIRCIFKILDKLAEHGVLDKKLLADILPVVHFLDGEGGSMLYMCRLAKSQKSRVIVFHDGDNNHEIKKITATYPDITAITLPAGKEFEDMLPRASYFEALAELQAANEDKVTIEEFDEWKTNTKIKPGTLFSKQVDRFEYDTNRKFPTKHEVMSRAIEIADPTMIESEPFKSLLDAMAACASCL